MAFISDGAQKSVILEAKVWPVRLFAIFPETIFFIVYIVKSNDGENRRVMKRKMKEGKKRVTIGLVLVIASVLIVACAPPAFALPTADNVGIADYTGEQGSYVIVPVTITNVQDGPIISMVFDVCYDKSVLEVVNVQNGDLTTSWNEPAFNDAFAWGTRVSLVYQGETAQGLQNGATGSLVLLNFSVSGEPGATSWMNLTNIQFSDTAYKLGTAPANNGTFTISASLFEDIVDSFEIGEWNGLWIEDSQKDWFRSTQRAMDGSYSAEVDGRARDATLTMVDSIDLSGKASAMLTFSWYIEDSWDRGDYLAFDIYDGTWHEVKRLSGNEDQENVWYHETIDLTPYMVSSFKIRFRATVSNSVEDGNVDNVKITSVE
jgi:hypothetical protein